MSIVWMIVIGLVIGLLARALKPGDDRMGILMTILLGIAGSFLAGIAGQQLGFYAPGEPAGFIASVIGAIVLLLLYGLVSKR